MFRIYSIITTLLTASLLNGMVLNTIEQIVLNPNFNTPKGVAITPDGATAYVINPGDNSISIIDVASNTVTSQVSDPSSLLNAPRFIVITPDGTKGYIINDNTNTISILDVGTNTITQDIEEGMADYDFRDPKTLAFSPDGLQLYVVSASANAGPVVPYINVVFIPTNTIVALQDVAFSTTTPPSYIAVTPDDIALVSGGGKLYFVDFVTPVHLIPSILIPGAGIVAVSPDGLKAYVANATGVSVIDTTSQTLTGTITGTIESPVDIVFSPNGSIAYLINASSNSISIVDVASNTVIGAVDDPLNTLNNPTSLALTSNNSKGFITNFGSPVPGSVSVLTFIPIPAPTPLPPSSIRGYTQKNIFLTQTEFINVITWTAPTEGLPPVEYRIYRSAELTQLVATVAATAPLQYCDRNREPNVAYNYCMVSIDASGTVSPPKCIRIISR